MPYKRKYCAAFGCSDDGSANYFHFPRNPERQTVWIKFSKNPKLQEIKEKNLPRNKYLCSKHFEDKFFKTKEKKSLLPSATPSETVTEQRMTIDHLLPSAIETTKESGPLYSPTPRKRKRSPCQPFHHSPLKKPCLYSPPSHPPSPSNTEACIVPSGVLMEHAYSFAVEGVEEKGEIRQSNFATNTSTSCVSSSKITSGISSLTPSPKDDFLSLASTRGASPRKKLLYGYAKRKEKALKRLKRKMEVRKRQSLSVKQICRLNPEDFFNKANLSHKMSQASAVFLRSQMRCSKRKPKGRRWTLEEKVMALSLYKKGAKVYRFMRCMFSLPSIKTLNNLLTGFPFEVGINQEIFSTLSATVQKLEDCDKMCVLQFDEMSILEHFSYNASLDRIVGLEDYGNLGRTSKIANHALVFMVSGLLKKWKQPVAYYFSNEGVPGEILVQLISSVLHACTEAGLRVMATVCDMGTNQVKALKLLGSSKEKPEFSFEGENIQTIFDPPHLMKCIKNQLMRHNVTCEWVEKGKRFKGE